MPLVDSSGNDILSEKRPDGFAVPHVFTFASLFQGGFKTYFQERWDEALRHHRTNALAMRRDAWLMALLRERKDGTLRLKWHLEPDNDKDMTEKAAAGSMTKVLRSIRRIKRIERACLEALWYGRYAVHMKWGWKVMNLPTPVYSGPPEAGMQPGIAMAPRKVFTVLDHRPVNGDKIAFTFDGTPAIMAGAGIGSTWGESVRMITTNIAPAVVLDTPDLRRRFLVHSHDPDDADYFEGEQADAIHGVGIRSRVYWLNWMREEYISWYVETLERIGLGVIVVKYDLANADAKKEAEKTAKNFSRRSVLLVPVAADQLRSGSQAGVEVVEAPTAGIQMVVMLQEAIEAKIERYIVGQTLSAGTEGSGLGGTGVAQMHADTKQDIIAADAAELGETLTGSYDDREPGLVDQAFRWTFPELNGKFPLRWVYNVDETDPAKMEMVAAAAQIGVTFPMDEVRMLTGVRAPEEGEEIIGGAPQMPGDPNAEEGDPTFGDDEDDLDGEPEQPQGQPQPQPQPNGRVSVGMNGKGFGR